MNPEAEQVTNTLGATLYWCCLWQTGFDNGVPPTIWLGDAQGVAKPHVHPLATQLLRQPWLLRLLLVFRCHAFQDAMAVQNVVNQTHAMILLAICTAHQALLENLPKSPPVNMLLLSCWPPACGSHCRVGRVMLWKSGTLHCHVQGHKCVISTSRLIQNAWQLTHNFPVHPVEQGQNDSTALQACS